MFARLGSRASSASQYLTTGRNLRIINNERDLARKTISKPRLYSNVLYGTGKQAKMHSMFDDVKEGPADPMFDLKKRADNDASPSKVDLGVGIYRSEQGKYHELKAVKAAKQVLDTKNLGHNYELTTGNEDFLQHAAEIVFGAKSGRSDAECVSSVQTISGTGSCHLAAMFLQRCYASSDPSSIPAVYIGTPAWGNYDPLFRLVGFPNIVKYTHYSPKLGKIDFDAVLSAIRTAPQKSIFVLQACCHNPSGMDFSRTQWETLASEMKARDHFPFFDIAYQGLGGKSMDDDAWPVRYFAQEMDFEMVVCQSFSKNFGLYGERCGVLHVVARSPENAARIKDQLRSLIRWEFSSSPAYGSRLVTIVANDGEMKEDWLDELSIIRERLRSLRSEFYTALMDRKIPGDWTNVTQTTGLFCLLPLTPEQVEQLCQQHIYLPPNGRINISGLNKQNLNTVVTAIEKVVKGQENKFDAKINPNEFANRQRVEARL